MIHSNWKELVLTTFVSLSAPEMLRYDTDYTNV